MPQDDLNFLITNYRRLSPGGRSLLQRLVVRRAKVLRADYLRKLWRRLVYWQQNRAAVAQLSALDDASLKDIGLHRSGIEAAVYQLPKEPPRPRAQHSLPEKPHLCLQRTG